MMTDLTAHIAKTSGLGEPLARQALGIVLNAAERQDSALAGAVFRTVPGTRQLAARSGSEIGAPTGEIARLIEQTPGGRRRVVEQMFSALHALGLGHAEISVIPGAIAGWMQARYGAGSFTGLGGLIGHDTDAEAATAAAARAA
jgi:hypothetical protein